MKTRELANIVLKAMGIYWLVSAMLHVIHGAMMPFSELGNIPGNIWKVEIVNWILVGVLYALMSYLLLFRTHYALRLIKLDEDKTEPIKSYDSAFDYKGLAFALIGIYFVVPAISLIIPQLIKLWSLRQAPPASAMFQESYFEKTWTSLFKNAIQLVIGTVLIIGRSRLTQMWQRLRPLSTSSEEDSETK